VIERLERAVGENNLYRTDIHGTIVFTTDGKRLWVKAER
jgi:beta-lactamase superfamily II metal-dependent hydrolase